jgi:hypothetical protein
MSDMTLEEAEVHVDLAETMAWCQRVNATIKFYKEPEGAQVRVACHTDPGDHEVVTFSVQPVADDSAVSLAKALTDAGVDVVAQVQRSALTVVR